MEATPERLMECCISDLLRYAFAAIYDRSCMVVRILIAPNEPRLTLRINHIWSSINTVATKRLHLVDYTLINTNSSPAVDI